MGRQYHRDQVRERRGLCFAVGLCFSSLTNWNERRMELLEVLSDKAGEDYDET